MKPLKPPPLDWNDGTAVNRDFADSYFSRDNGLAESEHVFLVGNQLPGRFAQSGHFCIGELGFGTGLNFLLSARLWAQQAPAGAKLDYIAVEAAPMNLGQMRQALSPWPELSRALTRLGTLLPDAAGGFHCIDFAPDIRLLLLYGDVAEMLPRCRAAVDAWFLDGFAPARNPAMWSEPVLQQVARLSASGASFATYSAAGRVRRGLQQAGFAVRKAPGFGRKREMLCGEIRQPPADPRQPWFRYPLPPRDTGITILGDGITGACLARQLAEDGREVTVIGAGEGATHRIPGFLVRRYPEAAHSPRQALYDQAFVRAQDFYLAFAPDAVDRTPLRSGGDPDHALVVSGAAAARALLDHPRIQHERHRDPASVERQAGRWQLQLPGRQMEAGQLLLCSAEPAAAIREQLALPTAPCSGQAITLAGRLEAAYAGDIHAFPWHDQCLIGSSYRRDQRSLHISAEETADLLQQVQRLGLSPGGRKEQAHAHTGLRISSQDHLPIIGPAPDLARWRRDYADLHHGRPEARYPAGAWMDDLWLNLAHGSRGATMAPLAALLLASAIQNRPLPLPLELLGAIHPGRFVLRRLRRGAG